MKIGNLDVRGYVGLAPMAGATDRAMREICVNKGAALTVGELASSKGIVLGDKRSRKYLESLPTFGINGPQLFGSEPEIMAKAARIALEYGPDFIDINMGCPAPKIAGNGGGSALMRDTVLAGEIVSAVCEAVNVPVTVKMRTGYDKQHINAPLLAEICETAGAKMVTVHGRTRDQMYAPPVDYDTIREVKQAVKIPVAANGDVTSGKKAQKILEKTGCDFLLVGRAALGNPFIFAEINAYLEGRDYTPPTLEERLDMCVNQVELMLKYKSSHIALLEARKHTAWYLTGLNGAAALRRMCGKIESIDDVKAICKAALAGRNAP